MKPKNINISQPVRKIVPDVLEALQKSYAAFHHGVTSRELASLSVNNLSLVEAALEYLAAVGTAERSFVYRAGWSLELWRPTGQSGAE
jgi:hypothetical protein